MSIERLRRLDGNLALILICGHIAMTTDGAWEKWFYAIVCGVFIASYVTRVISEWRYESTPHPSVG